MGFVSHFVNDWTNSFFALVAPINESIWEHLKLLYFPEIILFLFTTLCLKRWTQIPEGYFSAQLYGILLGLWWITSAYYTYFGIIGRDWMWMDIAIFITACIFCQLVAALGCGCPFVQSNLGKGIGIVLIIVTGILFIVFTWMPPHLPFFLDASTGKYGI